MEYTETFISKSQDCPAASAEIPPDRGAKKSIPQIHYELLKDSPYRYTQEEVLWKTHVIHKAVPKSGVTRKARTEFFDKGQPCLRTSALAKRYGWGFHFNENSKVALVPSGTVDYDRLKNSKDLKQLTAMKNR